MNRAVVFAGPSLHGSNLHPPAEIELRPPAAKGDLLAAAKQGARRIGLIDGTFDHGAAVWHKEILFALAQGIEVLGAASMGALRAAECAAFGMVGVGLIYEDYASGRRVADSDVALVHGPAELGFPPLTDALVDIDSTLAQLLEGGEITPEVKMQLSTRARALPFKECRWRELCVSAGHPDLRDRFISQKRTDALALLHLMEDETRERSIPRFTFNDTLFFRELDCSVVDRKQVRDL